MAKHRVAQRTLWLKRQKTLFSPKGIYRWTFVVNMISGNDRTLSGYNHQRCNSYTGLRSATLCFAIQPLRGKNESIGDLESPCKLESRAS